MHQSTLAQLSSALESKQISSEELTRLYLDRCKQFNGSLNCFITINEEENKYIEYYFNNIDENQLSIYYAQAILGWIVWVGWAGLG